jgi:hypothetical protein
MIKSKPYVADMMHVHTLIPSLGLTVPVPPRDHVDLLDGSGLERRLKPRQLALSGCVFTRTRTRRARRG